VDHDVTVPLSACSHPSRDAASEPGHCLVSVCAVAAACHSAQTETVKPTHLLVWQHATFILGLVSTAVWCYLS